MKWLVGSPNHPHRSPDTTPVSIPNRLRSILADAQFVTTVSTYHRLPLIANERCGSWYIPPHLRLTSLPSEAPGTLSGVGSVYFKSTDGHHGQWAFSLRRLNLQLLRVLGKYGGAVVVDSTRRGKRMPDAFLKTVPIWVCVVNRVLFPEKKWELRVPETVGESERSQIESKVEGWCEGFRRLGLDLERLRGECRRPVRAVWAVNGEWEADTAIGRKEGEDVNLLVLCSASRRVRGAEVSEGGYIQGAGDDSEGWSRGLIPQLFWKHKKLLMGAKEEDLPEMIQELLNKEQIGRMVHEAVLIKPTKNIYIADGERMFDDEFDLVIKCDGDNFNVPLAELDKVLSLHCRAGKLGSKDLRDKLSVAKGSAAKRLQRKQDSCILITCSTGRDLSVGVALALLCLFFDDSGNLTLSPSLASIDKAFVKTRLAWITSCKPDANPSRSTLQAINSFLIDRPG